MVEKHVVIVELENSHDECLYSQVLFLESSPHKVSMILSEHAYASTKSFHFLCQHVEKVDLIHGFKNHWKTSKKIKQLFKSWEADILVLNTAQGSFVRDFCLFSLFYSKKIIGIIHTLKKLESSFTQKIISVKIKRYYLLSHILSDQLPEKKKKNIAVFYPMFFHHPILPQPFEKGCFNIVIPGGVESRRKDLEGWIKLIENNEIPGHWKMIFAGKSDQNNEGYKKLKKLVSKKKVESQFKFFDDFIDPEAYFKIIESAHVILPLIHPNTPSNEEYMTRQISGSFNLAYGFRIPLFIHEVFNDHEEFQEAAFFYTGDSLFNELKKTDKNRSLLEEKRKNIRSFPLFQFEKQQSKYLKWIEL